MADRPPKKTNPPKGKKIGFPSRKPAQREGGKPRLDELTKENKELFQKAITLELELGEIGGFGGEERLVGGGR